MEKCVPQNWSQDSALEYGVTQIRHVGQNILDGHSPHPRLEIGVQEIEENIFFCLRKPFAHVELSLLTERAHWQENVLAQDAEICKNIGQSQNM